MKISVVPAETRWFVFVIISWYSWDLYPLPVKPTLTDVTAPNALTVTVPAAETRGWYPKPSVEPIDWIMPAAGKLLIPTS